MKKNERIKLTTFQLQITGGLTKILIASIDSELFRTEKVALSLVHTNNTDCIVCVVFPRSLSD